MCTAPVLPKIVSKSEIVHIYLRFEIAAVQVMSGKVKDTTTSECSDVFTFPSGRKSFFRFKILGFLIDFMFDASETSLILSYQGRSSIEKSFVSKYVHCKSVQKQ